MATRTPRKWEGGKQPRTNRSGIWYAQHPPATTYQADISHAWDDGRAFIRGAEAIYCHDLRK